MKVLVTGATGFLGSWIAQRLLEDGHQVRTLCRKTSNRTFLQSLPGIEFAEGTIEDADAVLAATEGTDAVIHSAGLVKARDEAEFHRVNVEGTRNLAKAAAANRKTVKRLVVVSSLEAAGPSTDGSPVALDQDSPVTAYGRSKLASEKAALAFKDEVDVVILRPGAIYGPRDQEILEAFRSVSRGLLPTIAGGNARGVFIYASDCADACIRALHAKVPTGSTYFVDDGTGAISQRGMLEDIERALGKKALIRFSLPKGFLKAVSHSVKAYGRITNRAVMLTPEKADMLLKDWVSDSGRTRNELNWKPQVPWTDGVQKTVDWYKQNGWL
ncbi:MAG: NAD-dependent epimerase/dehydratase family protein [Myxococcaceae bacterium]